LRFSGRHDASTIKQVADIPAIFDASITFDPSMDFEAFLKQAPAKWAVYLLADEHDQPVQLLSVKNLRASLKRRLGGEETIGLSKRVNYREIVRRIYWRRVDSGFEADWIYLEAARQLFPRTYQGMLGFKPAWFVQVDPTNNFPRYVKTIQPLGKRGLVIGPLEDKHAAARLIQLVEDSFDLCRYYNILVESPNAKACAYKEMGKCPAPCDGTITMDEYRKGVERSALTILDPGAYVTEQGARMQELAQQLQFEQAGKIKAKLDEVNQFGKTAFRYARRIDDFRFVSLQRGPRDGCAKIFLVTPCAIEEVAGLVDEPQSIFDLLRYILERAECRRCDPLDDAAIERIGMVAHHLFSGRHPKGVFLRLEELEEKAMVRSFRELSRQKVPEEVEGEGVLKELQAM
jgi:excinuclease UvrABC nuclease subunit